MLSENFPPTLWKVISWLIKFCKSLNPVAAMRLLPMIEEDIEQCEEYDYEENTCSTSYILCRDDVDYFLPPYYHEPIWNESTSVSGQVFNGKNSKKYSQYFMEYCALKEEIREVLSFRYLCTL